MNLKALVCSLVILTAVVVDGPSLAPREAHAQFIGNRPFGGRRQIELNIRGSAFYGYNGFFSGAYNCGPYGCNYGGSYGIGPGIQMLFPVLHNGFIPSINNAFYLGFSADFVFHPGYYGDRVTVFGIPLAFVAQWRFILFPIMSLYANVGGGFWPIFYSYSGPGGGSQTYFGGFPLFELGMNLHFTRKIGMNFEFGYPAVRIGLNISF